MPDLKKVGGTAFILAGFKAEGAQERDALYQDPVIGLFLDEESWLASRKAAETFPPAKGMAQVRTRYFDDSLKDALFQGFRQVVLLGSGLDTRPIRFAGEGITFFEIDRTETLQWKESILAERGYHPSVTYLPGNYLKMDFLSLLEKAGFQRGKPAFFLWEGNTTYLRREEVEKVLTRLKNGVENFRLCLDYMSDKVISKTTGYADLDAYIDHFVGLGAPWLTGFGHIGEVAEPLGFEVVENFSTAERLGHYRPGRPIPSPLFGFYFVCTLKKQ